MHLVTLSSDFGTENEGPGIMEATILGIAPNARVVHLSHGISPFNIIDGARQMETVLSIPPGIHVCVVDPGVGSDRGALVVALPRAGILVGPDNGVLMAAAAMGGGATEIRRIENRALCREPISSTFHGRDVFATVAGHLARGVPLAEVGAAIGPDQIVPAPYADAILDGASQTATVLHINRYGNCILNLRDEPAFWHDCALRVRPSADVPSVTAVAVSSFSAVANGEWLLYPDSYGRMALAINCGHAARVIGASVGTKLEISVIR